MTRFIACVALVVLVGVSGGASQPQDQVFRGTSDAVRVFVTVTDGEGRLVTTLKQNDFEIRDEGKPQPITLFDNTPQPIKLIVMLDVSGSMFGNLQLLRAASQQLFARLRADDGVRVGTFGHEVAISETFTRDPGELRKALPEAIAEDAPTPLWRAVDDAVKAFGEDAERPVILVFSDGKDSGPTNFRERYVSQAEAIEHARTEGVMVYAIGLRSRNMRPSMPGLGPAGLQAMLTADLPDPGLARVAEDTGGGYTEIRFGQDLGAAFAQVADELHAQYLLGFAPPKKDGKEHEISVRLAQKGMKPRARKSYIAPRS
jgi:VWFA-related protein